MRHWLAPVILAATISHAFGQDVRFLHITAANGLSDNSITALLQDRDGFLWIGTGNGLNRYDGHHTWTWRQPAGTEATQVTGIIQGRDGRIHACFSEHAVATFSSSGQLQRVDQPATNMQFTCLYDLNDTTLLVGGRQAPLSFLDKRTGRFTYWPLHGPIRPENAATSAPDSVNDWCHYIAPAGPGRFAVGFLLGFRQFLVDSATGTFLGNTFTLHIPDQTITNVLLQGNQLTGAGWQPRIHVHEPGSPGRDKVLSVPDECTSLADAGGGHLWAGTRSMGLLRIDLHNGHALQYRHLRYERQSLSDDRVQALLSDREGRLWIGTRNGLNVYDPARNRMAIAPIRPPELPDLQANSTVLLPENRLAVCTTEGLFIRQGTGPFLQVGLRGPGGPLQINTIAPYGKQFLVGAEEGLFLWTGQGTNAEPLRKHWRTRALDEEETERPPPPLFQVRSIILDTLGGRPLVILGVLGYGLAIIDPAQGTLWNCLNDPRKPQTLGSNLVRTLARTTDGTIWAGTQDGLYRWDGRGQPDPDRFSAFRHGTGPQDLPGSDVQALLPGPSGTLWIGTRNGGLAQWDGRNMHRMHCPRPAGSSISGLLSDARGRIWCAVDNGFEVYDPGDRTWSLVASPFAQALDPGPSAASITTGGTMAFVAGNNLVQFDPLWMPVRDPVPPPYLTGLWADGDNAADRLAAGRLKLASDQQVLKIMVSALALSPPGGLKFTVQLQGIDQEPLPSEADGSLTYASLPPGTWPLWARTVSTDGRSSAPVLIATITKAAPVWQQPWFYLLVALAAGGTAYGLTRLRYRQRLQLQAVRNRIASDLHDEVGSSLSSITLGSQLARKLDGGENAQVAELLARIGDTSSASLRSISDIVWAIDPRNDEGEALVERMRRITRDLLESKGVDVGYDIGPRVDDLKLPMNTRKEIVLIFKEAVHNTSKYSRASTVQVCMHRRKGKLAISVKDDGMGFDPALHPDGHGLGSMKQRAAAIGAELTLASAPGLGTLVGLEVQLHKVRH